MMDINQAARMIEWLDEERRRDKAMIATLEDRLAKQQEVMEALHRRLNGIESDQNLGRNQFVTMERQNEALETIRRDVRQMIEGSEAKRLTAEREAERRADLARENALRPVRELNDRIAKVERSTGDVSTVNASTDRINSMIAILQQKVEDLLKRAEEPERRVGHLEENFRDIKRRLSQLESETPESQKQIDSLRPKLSLLEDLSLRNERRIQEIQTRESERREQIQQFIDQQTLMLQQRDRQVDELLKTFGHQDSLMQDNIKKFESWSETHRQMRKIIDDFERIGDRLERRINEVAEMQRLSEERFRQEWNDWRDEDQKRWKHYTLSTDDIWRSHDKEFGRFVDKVTELEARFTPLDDQISRLWGLERARAQLYRERYQALLEEYDTLTRQVSANGANGTKG